MNPKKIISLIYILSVIGAVYFFIPLLITFVMNTATLVIGLILFVVVIYFLIKAIRILLK